MEESRYSGVYDAALRMLNSNFDPQNLSVKEKKLYVLAFLDWVKFNRLDLIPAYLKNISPNEQDDLGNTAIFYCRSIEMLDLLLGKGAEIFIRNIKNSLPIASAHSLEIFKALLKRMKNLRPNDVPDLNDVMTSEGLTFFQVLIASKSFEVVNWLFENESNAKELGLSPPHPFYCIDITLDTMKIALSADAPESILKVIYANLPQNYNLNNFKLLLYSGYFGSENGIKFFSPMVKDIDEEFGDEKATILMVSAANSQYKTCKALLELGGKPNKKCGNYCCSALSSIIKSKESANKKLALLKLFSEKGAKFDETFENGDNLLSLAIKKEPEVFEFIASKVDPAILSVSIRGKQLIHLASEYKNSQMLNILFKFAPPHTLNVNALSDCELMTPLCFAAEKGSKDTCKLLLASGANPDLKCKDLTARKYAKRSGYSDLAKELKTYETESNVCC